VRAKTRDTTCKTHSLARQIVEPSTFSLIFPCKNDAKKSEEETVRVQRAREEIVE
jgi:hypothetical protein